MVKTVRYQSNIACELASAQVGGLPSAHREFFLEKIIVAINFSPKQLSSKDFYKSAALSLHKISEQKPTFAFLKRGEKFAKNLNKKVLKPRGCFVTLRKHRMLSFTSKLSSMAQQRRDEGFPGFSGKNFDGQGNCSYGFADQQQFFAESYVESAARHGLCVTLCFRPQSRTLSTILLQSIGLLKA